MSDGKTALLQSSCDCMSGVMQNGSRFICTSCGAPWELNHVVLRSLILSLDRETERRLAIIEAHLGILGK